MTTLNTKDAAAFLQVSVNWLHQNLYRVPHCKLPECTKPYKRHGKLVMPKNRLRRSIFIKEELMEWLKAEGWHRPGHHHQAPIEHVQHRNPLYR